MEIMDLQKLVDGIGAMACIISVEKKDFERHGKIRIVAGNKAYVDSIEKPAPGTVMLKDKFVPDSEYTDYLTRDLNFEDYCFRAAVHRRCLHSYANPDRMNIWINMTFIPVGPDDGDLLYCLYIMEFNFIADSKMLSNISGDVATAVLDISLKINSSDDFEESMNDVIKEISEICEAEHCCILPMNTIDRTCYVLCEAFSKDTKLLPMKTYVDEGFYDIAESWEQTIAGSNCLIAKNEEEMQVIKERNPVWYDSLTNAGAKNIVLFPLKYRDDLLGYIWAINFNALMAPKIKEVLEVSTYILGVELGNHLLLDKLKVLSSKDMLTGVMNRNEMNNFIDRICNKSSDNHFDNNQNDIPYRHTNSKRSVCVIFSDLNGLKTINDERGHSEGDALLKNAANALREIFDEREIFRAGGDEFTMIIPDMTEETMQERIEQIRKAATKYPDLVFALGGCYVDDIKNIRYALKVADERMYEDKAEYYKRYPEKKKR